MFYLILILFTAAALFGLVILKSWLTSSNISRTTIYLHGVFAAIGLVLLLINALRNPVQGLKTSLILFVIAALGGFLMFFRDINKKNSPNCLAIVHALLAGAGFVFLLVAVLK